MSRQIDLTKRLSKEDEDYLRSRSREHEIVSNRRKFGVREDVDSSELSLSDFPENIVADVKAMKKDEVKAELDELEVEYASDARVDDLRVLLAREYAKDE